MRSERLRTLKGELSADIAVLADLERKYERVKAKLAGIEPDEFDYAGLAYTIVNIYALMENGFLRIAKAFENDLDRLTWHKDLVRRMAVEIEGVRPALLDPKDVPLIDELRAFRHVFRFIYQTDLDVEKLKIVDAKVPGALAAFRSALARFLTCLNSLIRESERGS